MRCSHIGIVSVFFAVCCSLPEDEICPRKHHALIIAFLALHGGDNCRELVQRGVQQRIALESALESINSEYDLQLGLKFFDTCSDRNRAVESALKGLLFAEKRCSKFPVFLGFLGPDDRASLDAINRATVLRNYSHVVPGATWSFDQYHNINVETIHANDKARRIAAFLSYLNWSSFILVFTSDDVSTDIATYVLESEDFCLTNSVLRVPSFASAVKDSTPYRKLQKAVEDVNYVRILVITDDTEVINRIMESVEDEWGDFQFVLYVQGCGILPWRLPKKAFQSSVILHEVPRSPVNLPNFQQSLKDSDLWKAYVKQIDLEECTARECRDLNVELEPTIVPYVYALHLFSAALKTATRRKCKTSNDLGISPICDDLKNMSQTEWASLLQDTVTTVADETRGQQIRFYMSLDNAMDIIVYNEKRNFQIVGTVSDDLIMYDPQSVNKSKRSRIKQCFVDMYEYEIEEEKVKIASPEEPEEKMGNDEVKVPLEQNFGYYELLATVIGFPIGIVVLIGLAVVCVYRSFRVNSKNHQKTNLSTECEADDFS